MALGHAAPKPSIFWPGRIRPVGDAAHRRNHETGRSDPILKEGRRLAPAPVPPTTLAGWRTLPEQIDAYLKDRFGLRRRTIRLRKDLTRPLVPEGDPKVLVGRKGRMFFKLDDMVVQSAGLLVRDKSVSDTADTARRNTRFARPTRRKIPGRHSAEQRDDLPG